MITKVYALKDLDTSRLPPIVQKTISTHRSDLSDKPLTHIYGRPGPSYNEEKGTYHQTWVVSSKPTIMEDGYWFCVVASPWISPPVDQFLENIRTDK